jgi:hypothetical protein
LLQLGIKAWLMGITVMPLVITAIKISVIKTKQPRPPGNGIIKLPIGKGSAMAAFMHHTKAKGQTSAKEQQCHEAEAQGQTGTGPGQGGQHYKKSMAQQLAPTGPITTPVEQCQIGSRNQFDGLSDCQ